MRLFLPKYDLNLTFLRTQKTSLTFRRQVLCKRATLERLGAYATDKFIITLSALYSDNHEIHFTSDKPRAF
jgi:hypothetical protein